MAGDRLTEDDTKVPFVRWVECRYQAIGCVRRALKAERTNGGRYSHIFLDAKIVFRFGVFTVADDGDLLRAEGKLITRQPGLETGIAELETPGGQGGLKGVELR